jgi:hypothetical protein
MTTTPQNQDEREETIKLAKDILNEDPFCYLPYTIALAKGLLSEVARAEKAEAENEVRENDMNNQMLEIQALQLIIRQERNKQKDSTYLESQLLAAQAEIVRLKDSLISIRSECTSGANHNEQVISMCQEALK